MERVSNVECNKTAGSQSEQQEPEQKQKDEPEDIVSPHIASIKTKTVSLVFKNYFR